MEDILSRNIPEKIDFPKNEEAILALWEKLNAFQTSLKLSEGRKPFTFYDGPPFATGLPHYGHLLAGTIKDVVTRYAHQTGHYVSRRFGWDCHGLPVEHEIDQKLNITSSHDVAKLGIANYNKECRGIVTRYCSEWRTVVGRLGRWIDFDNDYKTLEPWYMESVWNVFKRLYETDKVYRGYRVMPYSTSCTTPISNFEAGLNYKEVSDPAVIITFPMVENPEISFLAWTTTPWTLPSNLALCVNSNFDYVQFVDIKTQKKYIMGQERLSTLYPKMTKPKYVNNDFVIEKTYKGIELKGKRYIPLFDCFKDWPNAFQVLCDDYVTSDSGTCIVHQAPGFGEDDFRVCMENGIIIKGGKVACPLDPNGVFTSEVPKYEGIAVKESDKLIMNDLHESGRLLQKGSIVHSYPYCWRSETPLIYRAVDSWFVRVHDFKDQLLAASGKSGQNIEAEGNEVKTNWIPSIVKNRFNQWLADAKDWNISRNRYWGTPLPIWISDDGQEIVIVGSIKELEELTGTTITDIHKESIDHLTIPSKQGKGELHHVPEVFDCWFESGSMPYAQVHYPFDVDDEKFLTNHFPADFIAEGLDQTRGWFYTLLVLSTALFGKSCFKNVICNGLVLAADGKKMSKRLKNYPDPVDCINKYGADAIRLYLISSPAVRAEPLKFQESGLESILKDVSLPWFNAFRFLFQCVQKLESSGQQFIPTTEAALKSHNIMDRWLLSSLQELIVFVRTEMTAYRLYTVVPKLIKFVESLTNVYVRLNRKRCKSCDSEGILSLYCLYEVLLTLSILMAPFSPFLSEYFYQKMRLYHPNYNNTDLPTDTIGVSPSVHYLMMPGVDDYKECDDAKIRDQMDCLIQILELGRLMRDKNGISLKKPLKEIIIISEEPDLLESLEPLQTYITSELNVLSFRTDSNDSSWCVYDVAPDFKALGQRLGKNSKIVQAGLKSLSKDQIHQYKYTGQIEICGHNVIEGELLITRQFIGDKEKYVGVNSTDNRILVAIDITSDNSLVLKGLAREFTSFIQKYRKVLHLQMIDIINVFYTVEEDAEGKFAEMVKAEGEYLTSTLQTTPSKLPSKIASAGILLGVTICTLPFGIKLFLSVFKRD